MTLQFYYNGIKDEKGAKLQKASYSFSIFNQIITIHGKNYQDFSVKVHEAFKVENDTDAMVDYFQNDRIRVEPSHPLYNEVFKAWEKQVAKRERVLKNYVG